MFTDRFIKLPGKTFDIEKKDMGLRDIDEQQVTLRILPSEIESYYNDWKEDQEVVGIQTKSGDDFYAYMTIAQFEDLLNEYESSAGHRQFINIDTAKHSSLGKPFEQ